MTIPAISPINGVSAGGKVAPVQPGQLIRALVLSVAEDGLLKIAMPGGPVSARAETPVKPGAYVEVAVGSAPRSEAGGAALSFVVRAPAAPAAAVPPPAADVQRAQAVAVAATNAAQGQAGLAPLMADLEQALATQAPPVAVVAAAGQLLARQTPVDRTPTAGAIRHALSQSGLFMEQRLALPASSTAQPMDLKALLLVLRQAAKAWSRSAATATSGAESSPGASPAPKAPPPYRGAPIVAQPPAVPALAAEAPPLAVAKRLVLGAEAALARQDLLQIASLPDAPQASAPEPSSRWMFDMPLATPQGPAAAQFEISRDGSASGAAGTVVWRARFSVDIEPMGPVHAQLAMAEGRIAVHLWAEREESLEALRRQEADLVQTLRQDDRLAELAIHPGAPRVPPTPAGRFVDLAS